MAHLPLVEARDFAVEDQRRRLELGDRGAHGTKAREQIAHVAADQRDAAALLVSDGAPTVDLLFEHPTGFAPGRSELVLDQHRLERGGQHLTRLPRGSTFKSMTASAARQPPFDHWPVQHEDPRYGYAWYC